METPSGNLGTFCSGQGDPELVCASSTSGKAGNARSTNEFRVALAGAMRAKIAGWCFHTDAGFTLIDGSFKSKLRPADREFLERME